MLAYLIYLQTEVGLPLSGGESAQHAICESLGPSSCNTTEFIQHLEETTIKTKKDCGSDTHDIIFVVDSSGSVGADGFDKIKVFLKNMIDYIWVDANTTSRIAIIVFSDDASTIWSFSDSADPVALEQTIDNTAYKNSGTETEKALDAALAIMDNEGRPYAVKTIALFTDGRANNKAAYLQSVQNIKDSGIILNLQSFGFQSGAGSFALQIDELQAFNQDVHLIDQITFYDGSTFIMRKICSGVLSIGTGSGEFKHNFQGEHTMVHLELDMEDFDGFELKADNFIVIAYDTKDPKPVNGFTGVDGGADYPGFGVNFGEWQQQPVNAPKIYLTVNSFTPPDMSNNLCLRLYKNAGGRKRRATAVSTELVEPKGCNINEQCTNGFCTCLGETDSQFPQLCNYDREYPAQYAVYARKRMFLIFASHSSWRNHNNLRTGELDTEFVIAKRRFFRFCERAVSYLEQELENSAYYRVAKSRGYARADYTPVFQQLEESLFDGEDPDICEMGRNLIYSMKSAVYRYARTSRRAMHWIYMVEREWKDMNNRFDRCHY